MSDILSIRVGEVWRGAGMVARGDGSAIVSGTVSHYLKALTGTNTGKWWKNDDQTWAESETGTEMVHQADGRWTVQLAASPFEAGVIYLEYAKESGNLHVPGEGRMLRGVLTTQAECEAAIDEKGHLLQSPDAGATALSRFDASTDEVTTDEASRDASKATGFLESLGTTAPAGWIDAAAVADGAVTKIQAGLSTFAGGAVASVTGDIGGKVIGGGSTAITGIGARTDLRAWGGESSIYNVSMFGINYPIIASFQYGIYKSGDTLVSQTTTRQAKATAIIEDTYDYSGAIPVIVEAALVNVPDSEGTTTLLTDWNDGGRLDAILDETLAQATAAAGASGGTGARTVAITVDDGTTTLQSARVRVTKGAESYLLSTDAVGLATFSLDDGTWTVAITLAGYTFTQASLVVAANVTQTYSMTAAGFTPSTEPDSVTIQWLVINAHDYAPIGGGEGTITIRIKEGPGTDGYAWGKNERSATTDANGMIEFTNVPVGATIRARLGAVDGGGEWFDLTIPADATSPYDAGEIIGDAKDDGA